MAESKPISEEDRLRRVHDNIEYTSDADFGRMDEAIADVAQAMGAMRRELAEARKQRDRLDDSNIELLSSLKLMVAWHDEVKKQTPILPSPFGIETAKALAGGEGE